MELALEGDNALHSPRQFGYAMLMRPVPKKAETAVHHCPRNIAVRMRGALARQGVSVPVSLIIAFKCAYLSKMVAVKQKGKQKQVPGSE